LQGYSGFGTFTIDDFLPANLSNAQGLTTNFPAVGAARDVPRSDAGINSGLAESTGLNLSWSLNQAGFNSFKSANSNTANWKWNVVALDTYTEADGTDLHELRYLSTLSNSVSVPISQTSGQFANMDSVDSFITKVNAAASGVDDPAVYLTSNFAQDFGPNWKGRFYDSTSNVGDSARFMYLTGRSNIAVNEQYAGLWNFSVDQLGAASLTYSVAAVPEADSSAMILAGIGLMGFIARRRKNNG
jgi:hypothetical protein